jgi:branched-chain amino acid transport system ATP-binding protein
MTATPAATPVLSVDGLGKTFGGVRAVADVSFTVAAGEVVALIGPNGAGKSTCFNMLGGQLRPDEGRIHLKARDITGFPPHAVQRAGVGRTFQIARVFGSMTVRENVQTALSPHAGKMWSLWRRARRQHRDAAAALLTRVGLAARGDRRADHLPYGDVKRLELAMALANDPALLLMDEPTAGMAREERDILIRLVASEAREAGRAVLFTEHDMDVVFGQARRVLVMDRGGLIAAGPPDTVRDDPAVQRIYLGTGEGGLSSTERHAAC